jgi:hypothetical protein
MKSLLLFLFISTSLFAQQAEVDELNKAFEFYRLYSIGKIDSLPQNPKNYARAIGQLDSTFKAFILHEKSQDYEKFKLAQGKTNFKFFRLDNTVEIDAAWFVMDSITYVVFSYHLQNQPNYFIKRLSDHKIVYSGNSLVCYVDAMYSLEPNKILLIEEDGDFNKSKEVSVISTSGKEWKPLKAFKGLAFGQISGDYRNKKFVDKRTYFQLDCDMDVYMTAPQDVNKVSFNENTKTLSYKQYDGPSRFKKIEAKWENGMFTIDDYNVGDAFQSNSPAMPR